jgi:hypothetical protein
MVSQHWFVSEYYYRYHSSLRGPYYKSSAVPFDLSPAVVLQQQQY